MPKITAYREGSPIPENYKIVVWPLKQTASEARVIEVTQEELDIILTEPIEEFRKRVRDLLYKF